MIPEDRRYTKTHEWTYLRDGEVLAGITAYAAEQLGDLTFVELPAVGRRVAAGEECIVVESVKAASDVYTPVAGVVTAANDSLLEHPELISEDPYGGGWIIRIKPDDPAALDSLMDSGAYQSHIEASDG